MKKQAICKSCSGPLNEFSKESIIKDGFCPYCVDRNGNLKSYGEILLGMLKYIESDHPEIKESEKLKTAQKWLKEGEVWRNKFVNEDVVVEEIRAQNFHEIPAMTKSFNCKCCLYYQNLSANEKSKFNWFKKIEKKYGVSAGMILYFNGQCVGFSQFAPKCEFKKLLEICPDKDQMQDWFISCIAIQKRFHGRGLGKMLLRSVLNYLKSKKIKAVYASALLEGDAQKYSSGYWKMYESEGFKKISNDGKWVYGMKKL